MTWLKDPKRWESIPLSEKLLQLRRHYCTGPCGQSHDVNQTRSVTDQTLREAASVVSTSEQLVEVCDGCLKACCWHGEFMCDNAKNCGTIRVHKDDLRRLDREHSSYWEQVP